MSEIRDRALAEIQNAIDQEEEAIRHGYGWELSLGAWRYVQKVVQMFDAPATLGQTGTTTGEVKVGPVAGEAGPDRKGTGGRAVPGGMGGPDDD